jgi:PAS domain S-box-containing protein
MRTQLRTQSDMKPPLGSPVDGAQHLRACLDDLARLMALPDLWASGGPPDIVVGALLDALLEMLRLEFVFLRVNDPYGGPFIETMRAAATLERLARPRQIGEALDASFEASPARWPPRAQVLICDLELAVASARLGPEAEFGVLVAGSRKLQFPEDTDRLLLGVAAQQAAIRLQQARLLSEQGRVAELDQRVAQRTSELAAVDEKLNKEVAERRRVEAALREIEHESRLIVDSIPGLVAVLTESGDPELMNDRMLEYFGKGLEEIRQWETNDIFHPEDLPQALQTFTQALASGNPYELEARLRRFDGAYRWFQLRGLPLCETTGRIARWYVLVTDIDDLKRAQEEVRRACGHLSEAQRLSQTGSFTSDLLRDVHTWSDEFYRICDFEPGSEVNIQRLGEIVHPEDVPLYQGAIQRALEGGDSRFDFRIVTSRGVMKYLRGAAHRVEQTTGPVFVGAIHDVTASKVAEDALNKARSELAYVTRLATLSALTASIAHEVNQPLSGVVTNAGMCLRMLDAARPDIDGARETARRTIRDGNLAAAVITRLRDLFSKKEFTLELINLNEATREVIALLVSELRRNRVILQPELDEDLPSVTGDRIQLQQVILNLLRNASEAMAGVDDRPRQLVVGTAREDDDRVRLTVRDTGVGVDPQCMVKLFDPFYTTKSGGMGIGLSVSHSIIERHHGRLWAEPNDGPGATFAFSIPRDPKCIADRPSALAGH